jgi:hypothetical protein
MSNNYNSSDYAGMSLNANNELEPYDSQLELQQVSSFSQESPTEKRIEHMLLSHSKYYVYCE